MNVIIGIIVTVIVVLAIRELFTWYTKATKIVEQNDKIIDLLFTIAKHTGQSSEKPIEKNQTERLK